MTSFLSSAKHIHDVDSDLSYVEIIYERYTRKHGYQTYTDYINTVPLTDWVSLESRKRSIPYDKFLDTMVEKTLEVWQRMNELYLEKIMSYEQSETTYIRMAHATKILDPSFQPPYVNMKSAWQTEFITRFCKKDLPKVIQTCTNKDRLEYFFNVMRKIEVEESE